MNEDLWAVANRWGPQIRWSRSSNNFAMCHDLGWMGHTKIVCHGWQMAMVNNQQWICSLQGNNVEMSCNHFPPKPYNLFGLVLDLRKEASKAQVGID